MDSNDEQQRICLIYGASYVGVDPEMKLGISRSALDNTMPLNGLRYQIEGDTSGWYIWGGEEFSDDPDFFIPMHIKHVMSSSPQIVRYLGLPPGWRFLTVPPDYEDVWEDYELLDS